VTFVVKLLPFTASRCLNDSINSSGKLNSYFCRLHNAPKRLWKGIDQIRCDERVLAHRFARDIARATMQINGARHRVQNLRRMLRHHPSNHSCENIACAAGSHSRIACRIYPDFSVWLGDQRPMPL